MLSSLQANPTLTTYFWPGMPRAKTTRVIQTVNVPKNVGLFGKWLQIRVPEPNVV